MKKGITGVLRPNGQLLECSYGNHGVIAENIPIEEEMDCIYLSSSVESDNTDEMSILYFNNEISKEQLKWFFDNINRLDKKQYLLWTQFIKDKINIIQQS